MGRGHNRQSEKYKSQIKQLVKLGYLQFSSGSSSYLTAKSEGERLTPGHSRNSPLCPIPPTRRRLQP